MDKSRSILVLELQKITVECIVVQEYFNFRQTLCLKFNYFLLNIYCAKVRPNFVETAKYSTGFLKGNIIILKIHKINVLLLT